MGEAECWSEVIDGMLGLVHRSAMTRPSAAAKGTASIFQSHEGIGMRRSNTG